MHGAIALTSRSPPSAGAPESVVARCNYARLADGTKVAMSEKGRLWERIT